MYPSPITSHYVDVFATSQWWRRWGRGLAPFESQNSFDRVDTKIEGHFQTRGDFSFSPFRIRQSWGKPSFLKVTNLLTKGLWRQLDVEPKNMTLLSRTEGKVITCLWKIMSCLELRQCKNDSFWSKKYSILKLPLFSSPVRQGKKRGNFKSRNILDWPVS